MTNEKSMTLLKHTEDAGVYGTPETMFARKFGKLVVIERTEGKDNQRLWLCRCECGQITTAKTSQLRNGHKRSCGCLRGRPNNKELAVGESVFNHLYSQYQHTAKDRGLIFAINKIEFRKLTKGDCYYCGRPPFAILRHPRRKGEYVYNGVDRVDSKKGYIAENVVSCCKYCNRAKSDLSQSEFFELIKMVYENLFI